MVNESSLPGLENWIRVRDYRAYMISQMENIDVYLDSMLTADHVNDLEPDAVVVATGSQWRRDGQGANVRSPVAINEPGGIYTPDDIFAGASLNGDILIYDDEHYMMAGALAEKFMLAGHRVTYLTPATTISSWTAMTDEQEFIQAKLLSMGITTGLAQKIEQINKNTLYTNCIYTDESFEHRLR